MNSREKILAAIRQNTSEEIPLANILLNKKEQQNILENFIVALQNIGAAVNIFARLMDVEAQLKYQINCGYEVINGISCIDPFNIQGYAEKTAAELANVHTVFLKGETSVAENGAIWIPEKNMVNRLLPFICQHLVIVIEAKTIVADMHQAYDQISMNKGEYGIFVAGPSKTADIEQSLVIGAHGPLSLEVIIVDSFAVK